MPEQSDRPLLAVDVDGVISLFGFDDPTDAPGEFHLIDGVAHCISLASGERLRRLAEWYDLVWATGWEERANEYLPTLLGLPEDLPYLTFDGRARFGSAHWKLDAIGEYAGDRPLAWNPEHTNPPGGLANYFRNNVIGGPGAFVMVAENFNSCGQAIIKKLIAEIAEHPPPASHADNPGG